MACEHELVVTCPPKSLEKQASNLEKVGRQRLVHTERSSTPSHHFCTVKTVNE